MGDGGLSIETARELWATYERQLYPAAVSDPSAYERIILAVRALADELRSAGSVEQLLTMWPRAGEMLVSVVSARRLPVGSLPRDQVAGAAFALREREIGEQRTRLAQQERIDAARQSGDAWVVLDESGDVDSGLIDPYRCIEMHMETGFAVMSLVQPDPLDGKVSFVVAVMRLDPLSGDLLDAEPGIEDWVEHARQEDFAVHRNAVRARITAR